MKSLPGLWRSCAVRIASIVAAVMLLLGVGAFAPQGVGSSAHIAYAAGNACQLKSSQGTVQHVIYVNFDNVHLSRDNPNVPSDLEQMPNLLNFVKNNGVMFSNNHTPLIAHTGNDILTAITGVYGDRHGQPIANSYRVFNPDGTTDSAGTFAYWTSPVDDLSSKTPSDTKYTMLSAD